MGDHREKGGPASRDHEGQDELADERLTPGGYTARALMKRARILLGDHQWREASALLDEAMRLAPELADAYSLRASIHHYLAETEIAIVEAQKAIDLAPKSPSGWAQRGFGHARQANHLQAVLDYTEAIRLCESRSSHSVVLGNDCPGTVPLAFDLLTRRADSYIALRDYKSALIDLDKAIEAGLSSPWCFQHRGWVRSVIRDFAGAVDDYTTAISLKINDPHVYMWRSTSYFRLGMIEEATADAQKAVELLPTDPRAWLRRADGYRLQEQFGRAIDDYNEVIRLDADDAANGRPRAVEYFADVHETIGTGAMALAGRAECYLAIAEYGQALEDLGKVIGLNPLWPRGFERRAAVYRKIGDFERAWADCETALSLVPESPGALACRGAIHAHFRRERLAIADFGRAIKLSCNDAWTDAFAYCSRGLAYMRLRQFESAIDDLSEAIRLWPRWAEAIEMLGRAHFRAHEYGKAIEDFTRALEINPELKRALEYRALAREALGDYTGAARDRLIDEGLLPDDETGTADGDGSE